MMKRILLLLGIFSVALPAAATNGYFSHGYGTASKAMAGAGVALPLDTLSAATNPANMVHVGDRMDIGVALFNPERGYEADNNGFFIPPGEYDSGSTGFLIPSFGRNWQLDANSTLGLSIGANGGMNTDYSENPFVNFGPTSRGAGIDLAQIFFGLTYAKKINERHSVGITPIFIMQSFKAEGLEPFQALSIHPNDVTNNGRDWSYGAALRVGWLGKINDRLNLGASFQSRGYMTEFDDYRGLIAEEGDFDLPPQLTLGLAWKVKDDVTLALDYQEIYYSQINAISNTNSAAFLPGSLGGNNGLGFGWHDVGVIKLGVEWQYSEDLTLRAGYSHAEAAFKGQEGLFNILAPAVVRDHVSVGASWNLDKDSTIHLAFTRGLRESVDGSNINLNPQTGSVNLAINELEVSWSKRF